MLDTRKYKKLPTSFDRHGRRLCMTSLQEKKIGGEITTTLFEIDPPYQVLRIYQKIEMMKKPSLERTVI